ncbi:hypothetical protein ABZ650_04775 [Streptomyces griseoviridis]|uniref:hypothetical protein n=1 Tax=Streptomyces griseoviridis TaxID=45398 RepID=UPI0033C9D51F
MAEGPEQTALDEVMTRIGQSVILHHAGDREEARHRFLALWAEIGEHGEALHRCTLAHYLADTQDDPSDELAWDLRALTAAEELSDDRLDDDRLDEGRLDDDRLDDDRLDDGRPTGRAGAVAVRALYPSLHLNLAADYAKLGRSGAARSHLRRARGAAETLAEDRYGDGVRAAISRLELSLGEGGTPGEGRWGPPRQRP